MSFPVFIHQDNGHFVATLVGYPDVRVTAPTRNALAEMQAVLDRRFAQGELVFLNVPADGFMALAGKYKGDESLLEICEEIYRQRDAELKEWKAFDTDILTFFLHGDPACILKAALIPANERSVPIVVAEEMLRGRLDAIRQAQAGKTKLSIDVAYVRLEKTIIDLQQLAILSHSASAEALVQFWRSQKIKVGISDLRIAAICMVHSATLISRNRRDFDQVPGLMVEYW